MSRYDNRGRGGAGRGPAPDRRRTDRVRAPYNFVPVSDDRVFPDWAPKVSMDVPFEDGISGWLDLEIKAETPIFVRDSENRERFFRRPDGLRGIPGTSIKGMLRNVVEIATFSKMMRVNDHRYGVRDLNNAELYRKHMARADRDGLHPLVCSGWLRLTDGKRGEELEYAEDGSRRWIIEPCNFAKVEYGKIVERAGELGVGRFEPGRKQSSVNKYKTWGNASLDVWAEVEVQDRNGSLDRIGDYGKVTRLSGEGGSGRKDGRLVFTGQPQEYRPGDVHRSKGKGAGNPKHHDFFFYQGDEHLGGFVSVPYDKRRDFSFVHSAGGEQHRLDVSPNREWGYWLKRLRAGEKVPVFYLLDKGRLRAFGLAMMFRLAYTFSTYEVALRQQTGNRDRDEAEAKLKRSLDLAELIFGRVETWREDGRAKTEALSGRVGICTALEIGKADELPRVSAVLGGPKASYYPSYVTQSGDGKAGRGADGKPSYNTYMDHTAELRGWKRYQQREEPAKPPPMPKRGDGTVNLDVATSFAPLAAGVSFESRLHFHNLRPVELGALLWALDFGGRNECRHGLGLAKSLGYGGVKLAVGAFEARANRMSRGDDGRWRHDTVEDLGPARKAFVEYMERQLSGAWECSPAIQDLVSLATPVKAGADEHLRHMSIAHPTYRNEFQSVKLVGLALPPAADRGDVAKLRKEKQVEIDRLTAEKARADAERAKEVAEREAKEAAAKEAERKAAMSQDDLLAEKLAEAKSQGKHVALLKEWMKREGDEAASLRAIAKQVIGSPSKVWKKKNRELWDWLKGS